MRTRENRYEVAAFSRGRRAVVLSLPRRRFFEAVWVPLRPRLPIDLSVRKRTRISKLGSDFVTAVPV